MKDGAKLHQFPVPTHVPCPTLCPFLAGALGRSRTGNALNTITPGQNLKKPISFGIYFSGASQLRHSWKHSNLKMPKRKSTAAEAPLVEPPRRSLRNAQPTSEPVAAVKEVKKQAKKALPKGGQKTPQKVEEELVRLSQFSFRSESGEPNCPRQTTFPSNFRY